jgi:putative phosphoesterase
VGAGGERESGFSLGVISDTHGYLRPEVFDALQGVDLIIHAGDIGNPLVLEGLRTIAPVKAVRGNVDRGPWVDSIPDTEVIMIGGRVLYVLHDLGMLDVDPVAAGFSGVISGHSHRPAVIRRDGLLFLNPGSAGPRRFSLPVCLLRLHVSEKKLEARLTKLDPPEPRELSWS